MDDQQLLQRLVGQDREPALVECIRRYGPMVLRSAWRVTRDEQRAEDVCQAVFLVLVRKAGQLQGVQLLGAWLYRVAVGLAANVVKAEQRRRRREQEAVMRSQARSRPEALPAGVDEAINGLAERYRQVIVAHYLEGKSYPDLSAQLGVPEKTVQKRGERGLQQLRTRLSATLACSIPVPTLGGLLAAEGTAAAATGLTTAQAAGIHAAAIGGASVQVAGLASAASKALLWAKMKVYAAMMAAATVVAVPSYLLLRPAEGLVGHYASVEGGGTTVRDASPSGNHGTLVGGATWAAGRKPGSQALSFNGRTSYVKFSQDLNQWLGGSATVAFWMKTSQAGAPTWPHTGVTGVNVKTGDDDAIWGFLDETGRIGVCVGDTGFRKGEKKVQELMVKTARPVNDGQWHHLGFTRDAALGRVQIHVDGKPDSTAALSTGIRATPFFSLGRVEAIPDEANPEFYFQGLLEDVRFYDRVLKKEEIAALAQ